MQVRKLEIMLNEIFNIKNYDHIDKSINGLQIGDFNKEVKKIAFAVDSSFETLKEASDYDFLFTHHGLFWSREKAITFFMYSKIKFLIENNLALYACHIPLDAHPIYSHSRCFSDFLGLKSSFSFANYKGACVGVISIAECNFSDLLRKINKVNKNILFVKKFKEEISRVAIVSGNGSSFFEEALEYDIDLFITGDTSHQIYSLAEEYKINLIFAGHYFTETFGIKKFMKDLKEQERNLEMKFILKDTNL